MSPSRLVVALSAVALAASLSPTAIAAAPAIAALCQDGQGQDEYGQELGARAGDREPNQADQPPVEEAPPSRKGPDYKVSIPVHFHVLTDGATGRLTASQLHDQVNVLNATFAGREGGYDSGFSFTFASAQYIDNPVWFNMDYGTPVEREAKAATRVGGADVLNVWTTSGPSYLGFATFPSWYKTKPQLDGIVLDYNSLKGGAYGDRYSLGETGTHEVGHWLGLFHTFQGGCNAKGDYVADTPPMLVPTRGCPEGKDTCDKPGDDPIRNYMDYSYDSCYTNFTAGQAQRMRDQWTAFRAGGGSTVKG